MRLERRTAGRWESEQVRKWGPSCPAPLPTFPPARLTREHGIRVEDDPESTVYWDLDMAVVVALGLSLDAMVEDALRDMLDGG